MHLKGLLWIQAELFRWQLYPSGLGVMRVQINRNHDDVALVIRAFAEAENLRIIDRIESAGCDRCGGPGFRAGSG